MLTVMLPREAREGLEQVWLEILAERFPGSTWHIVGTSDAQAPAAPTQRRKAGPSSGRAIPVRGIDPPESSAKRTAEISSPAVYLSLPQVVERYAGVWSKWQLYEWTRTGQIPHRKLPGRRELLFPVAELEEFENGAELETIELRRGGRICRPLKR